MKHHSLGSLVILGLAAALLTNAAGAESTSDGVAEPQESQQRQYTFAWSFTDDATMKPRGGTTQGPEVILDQSVAPAFSALQQPDLTNQERDRRAILAMVGDYRTSFDFIETIGMTPGYEPRAPYQSWGTERVYLVADEPGYISLQHIIVMHFVDDEGTLSEPMVVKHWRQDWRYEDREVHAYVGRNEFAKERLSRREAAGRWTQTVYQVDDSPRYEALGRWHHVPGMSYWESEDRRRPLPRREFSVRDDYHALYGSHRITITPSGWSMEEDALKLVLDEGNEPAGALPYLAREAGLSRYERVLNYDFSAGDAYWEKTAPFWARVRDYWDALYDERSSFGFEKSADGTPMFVALFTLAEQDDVDEQTVQDTIARYLRED
ncbi:MAG: DUF6607 family protein [Pseudomonadota bacterium]